MRTMLEDHDHIVTMLIRTLIRHVVTGRTQALLLSIPTEAHFFVFVVYFCRVVQSSSVGRSWVEVLQKLMVNRTHNTTRSFAARCIELVTTADTQIEENNKSLSNHR